MPQLPVHILRLKILPTSTNIQDPEWCNQINKYLKNHVLFLNNLKFQKTSPAPILIHCTSSIRNHCFSIKNGRNGYNTIRVGSS